ncbi:MAG: deoxyribose-phosphate aldolase [Ruminococcaceae bacterium]|nr:deoxyribose-phosphate aldolase [Oscillospiraceae bacterium]
MNKNEIMRYVDHTLLLQGATWEDIKVICDDAVKYSTASVCIPPSYVKRAAEYLDGKVPVCTVIGFPNGYNTTAVKCAETADAIENGADEIDMVINIGDLKSGRYEQILEEIKSIKAVCGEKILKVIIETCLLTDEEKVRMCRIVTEAGADFIKTSTGFSSAGATFEDIKLFADNVGEKVQIKAAGGIKSFADAERFLFLGATRLGTSRLITLLKGEEGKSNY